MCGIFTYIGSGKNATELVIAGLAELEHRGYDSIGISRLVGEGVETYKISKEEKMDFSAMDLTSVVKDLGAPCSLAIGHNRWATFGRVTMKNAHPHHDTKRRFFVVHNGNVENLSEVEDKIGNWQRYSETDTEAIACMIAYFFDEGESFLDSVKITMNFIEGANVIAVISTEEPDKMIIANRGGTIILGQSEDGIVASSDIAALEPLCLKRQRELLDNEIAILSKNDWEIKTMVVDDVEKREDSLVLEKNYLHHMEEEIFSQPETLKNTLRGRLMPELGITHLDCATYLSRELRRAETFHFVGCGTAYHACLYASMLLNRFGISSRAWIASEFCYSHPVYKSSDAFVFVSQSGETADTLEVIKEIKIKGNIRLGIVNVAGSRIWRETEAGIGTRAGKELGVASTKAYTSQLASVAMLALYIARQREMPVDVGQEIVKELESLPNKISEALGEAEKIKGIVKKYSNYKNYYYLGRGFNSISAFEGSLKLKEISYIHSEAYPLGEMKHGPLALVDKDFCSVVIAPNDQVLKKSIVNIQEIKSRGGQVLAITTKGTSIEPAHDTIIIPKVSDYLSPIISVIPLQLFSYYMALELGKNPDKPRNLAKTVTVS